MQKELIQRTTFSSEAPLLKGESTAGKTVENSPSPRGGDFEAPGGFILRLPKRFQSLFRRVLLGESSPRQAIKAKCYDCMGFENVSPRVAECPIVRCPLWKFRPHFEAEK